MPVGGRSILVALVATALVLSPVTGVVGVADATYIHPDDTSSSPTVYPGQTVSVVNVSVASEDEMVYSSEISRGSELRPFGSVTQYAYINHGTKSDDFEIQDDVLRIFESDEGRTWNQSTVYNFNDSTVYIDDPKEGPDNIENEYNNFDDVYNIDALAGDPYVSTTGIPYSAFKKSTKYLSPAGSESQYRGEYPIIKSSDGTLQSADSILRSGTFGHLKNIPPEYKHINDQSGVSTYDPYVNKNLGEPIYLSKGDDKTTPDVDRRLTDVVVISGHDTDIRTVDLKLSSKAKVNLNDRDKGRDIIPFRYDPSLNEIDPNDDTGSDVGIFGDEDSIILDVDKDGYYDADEDIVLKGDPKDGTPYSTANINGRWMKGKDSTNYDTIIFDKGNNQDSNSDDLLIRAGTLQIGSAATYEGIPAPLKYWDSDASSSYSGPNESVYFDVNNDAGATGGVEAGDFRLTGFRVEYSKGTVISSGDMDAKRQITSFDASEYYIDNNQNDNFEVIEPVLSSSDNFLNGTDQVVVSGSVNRLINGFSTSGTHLELHYGTSEYRGYEPIVSLNATYGETSGDYNTNNLQYGESASITRFTDSGTVIEGYVSKTGIFEDGNDAVRLKWFQETSGEQIDTTSIAKFELNEFPSTYKFESTGDGYVDNSAIIQEKDTISSNSHYSDRLTTLTVHNRGTLPARAIQSVTLRRNGTAVATATDAQAGTWVLNPSAKQGTIDTSATNLTVTATIAADAPAGESVDFEISPLEDGGLADEFDAGDRGIFFADAAPSGGIHSGPTYTVGDPSDITASAVAFEDPQRNRTAAVELAFTDDLDPETTAPGDFAVETVLGNQSNVTGLRDDDGDGRLVLELEAGTAPVTVGSVGVDDGAVNVASGAAVPEQTFELVTTGVTVTEAAARSHAVYRGERIAVLANEGGNATANLDEAIRLDADTPGDGSFDELLQLGATGPSSLLATINTSATNATQYRATFRSEDGTAGESVSVPVRNQSLVVTANRTNTTDVAGPVGATIEASGRDRAIRAELLDAANGTVLASRLVRLDGEGSGTVAFAPRVATLAIAVTDLGTGRTNRTENVSVREGHPGATFEREVVTEQRGDVAQIGVRLVDTRRATVTIGDESVNYRERVTVVDRDDDGRVTIDWNTYRAGRNETGVGLAVRENDNRSRPDDHIVGVNRSFPAGPGLEHPLEAGEYALQARVDGDPTDAALLELEARATNGATTRVAPKGVDLETAADVANWSTPSETVAVGDQVVVAVDASGLGGVLNESTDLRRGGPAAPKTGAYVDVRRGNPPQNRPARALNVSHASSVLDHDDDHLYVVLPSGGDTYAVRAGQRYDATFVLNESSPYVAGAATPDTVEREAVETAFAFESPTGTFADLSENETLDLPATASATVGGETNVAPGTNVTITVTADDENVTFLESDTERVDEDGSFDGTVDLADYPEGTDYTVVATANGDDLTATRTGSITEAPVTVAAAQNVTTVAGGGGGGGGGSHADEESTATATTTRTTVPTTTDNGTEQSVGEQAKSFVTQDVPQFIATRATDIVVGMGVLALLYALLGLRRLTR